MGKAKLLLVLRPWPIGLCAFYLRTPPKTLKPIFSVIISSILSNCPSILWWISNLTAGFKTSPFATTLQRVQKTRKITSVPISDAGCMSHPRWPLWSSKVNEENCICTMWFRWLLCLSILGPRLILENHPRVTNKYILLIYTGASLHLQFSR